MRRVLAIAFLIVGCETAPGDMVDGAIPPRDAGPADAQRDAGRAPDVGLDAGPRDGGPADSSVDACVVHPERCDGDDDDCDGRIDERGADCALPFAIPECTMSSCVISSCVPLHADCDVDPTNGCETVLDTLIDCGSCGAPCTSPSGTPSCAGGICAIASCEAGRADCTGGASDGCETSTRTVTDCGGCRVPCAPDHASASCGDGTCRVGACEDGFSDCDGLAVNGCESSLASDATCGACDVACGGVANGRAVCTDGACVVASCDSGRADCDRDVANGCETSLFDSASCGACGHRCATGTNCRAGSCVDPRSSPTLSAGDLHTCALLGDGTVWCWGGNAHGELGRGTRGTRITDVYPTPASVGLADVVALSETSTQASCAIDRAGRVACWGEISDGAGSPPPTLRPTFASGIVGARAVSVSQVACVVLSSGRVRCWGFDLFGTGPILDYALRDAYRARPAAFGLYDAETIVGGSGVLVCAARRSGHVSCWGISAWTGFGSTAANPDTPRTVARLEDVVSLDAGPGHTCAVVADGRVACWGTNGGARIDTERLGDLAPDSVAGVPGWIVGVDDAVEVTAGGTHTCIRRRDGRVSCWGASYEGQLGNGTYVTSRSAVDVAGLDDAIEIDAGGEHTCAVRADHSVWCWGSNGSGQIGQPTTEECRPMVDSWECPDSAVPVRVSGLAVR